jgi:hypothetical protein
MNQTQYGLTANINLTIHKKEFGTQNNSGENSMYASKIYSNENSTEHSKATPYRYEVPLINIKCEKSLDHEPE